VHFACKKSRKKNKEQTNNNTISVKQSGAKKKPRKVIGAILILQTAMLVFICVGVSGN
jgi:hypothetical protein